MALSADEIREAFLRFFAERGHRRVPSSSLVPQGDPTLLFTNAGMVQFKGVFLGEETRDYTPRRDLAEVHARRRQAQRPRERRAHRRATTPSSRCSGNFSFGDYFKHEAIAWAWELRHERLRPAGGAALRHRLPRGRRGRRASGASEVGVPTRPHRAPRRGQGQLLGRWATPAPAAPARRSTIDLGADARLRRPRLPSADCDCDRWLEIWNLVFMQFDREPGRRA